MVVQHNLTAMNANRMLGITTGAQAKSTEKLSSGYKINRAADDAAGLSISEKMRKQIRGLTQASANAEDGISSVQTAEGALTEVQAMLQRMNELAVKASNGTMSENDRSYVQNEIDQLVTEIDRVAETTKFNETYLLKGTEANVTKTLNAHDAGFKGKLTDNGDGTSTFALDKALSDGDKISIAGKEYTIGRPKTDDNYVEDSAANALTLTTGDSVTADGITKTVVDKVTENAADSFVWTAGDSFVDADGVKWTVVTDNGTNVGDDTTSADDAAATGVGNVEESLVASKLNPGSVITVNDDEGIVATKPYEVVGSLTENEYSSLTTALTAQDVAGAALKEDDVIVQNGISKTVTAETPESFADISKAIMQLEADAATANKVQITNRDGAVKTFSVSTTTDLSDANNLKATREDIINMIQNGDDVKVMPGGTGGTLYTIYGVDEAVDADAISATKAYRMIADELAKASSIGTDAAAIVVNNDDGTFEITQGTVEVKEALTLNLHVGADADTTNKISVELDAMSAAGLGVMGLDVTDTNGTDATYAIDAIEDAIQRVSTQRSALGAIQNRLEHTIDNLDNVVENTTSAESLIRDTDMATEMVNYSKNQILAQAGQAMLAQAKSANQGVLSLLQ